MKKLIVCFLLIIGFSLPCFAVNKIFLKKEDQTLPDNYGVKIVYITGKAEEIELASHYLNKEIGILEIWTKDDVCQWLPITNIQKIVFDKRFSQMIAIKQKQESKK